MLLATALLLAACGFGITGAATAIGSASATLTGVASRIEPGEITYWFEYGTTDSYGMATESQTLSITAAIPVESVVVGLDPHTSYHYRLCVDDDKGHGLCGKDRTFSTTAPSDTVVGNAAIVTVGAEFGVVVDARSDWDGADPAGTASIYPGDAGGFRDGIVSCLRVVGDRASIGFVPARSVDDNALIFVEQAGPDGRSRFFITVVDEPPSVCPAPPTGDFGMVSTFGGFQVVDTP